VEQVSYAASDGGIDLIPGYRHKLTQASIGEWNLWGTLKRGDPAKAFKCKA
jgi:hypothetical protein